MKTLQKLNTLLRQQPIDAPYPGYERVMAYAQNVAMIEHSIVVVSDMAANLSKIYSGAFAKNLGLKDYNSENSIWEKNILDLMTDSEREAKYLAELRFFHYLRHIPKNRRGYFRLATQLRMKGLDVLHRMTYVYDESGNILRYAICIYEPLVTMLPAKSIVIDSSSGVFEVLSDVSTSKILSKREIQVLSLIESGKSSRQIADTLSISHHTINRHRQNILGKLQANNSPEACRLAKSLGIL